ncbi:putative cytosol aminopeptidase [Bacteroidia bacterium]|nr:putative cytosol aminopeptidase [Bacteroidia bacterium]
MLHSINQPQNAVHTAYLLDNIQQIKSVKVFSKEKTYILEQYQKNQCKSFCFNRLTHIEWLCIETIDNKQTPEQQLQQWRLAGYAQYQCAANEKIETLQIVDYCENKQAAYAFVEGLLLSHYHYDKHKSKAKTLNNTGLQDVFVVSKYLSSKDCSNLQSITDTVHWCRDLVNEPHNFQSAVQFAESLSAMAKTLSVKVEVLDKKRIETLRMGGLLGVNKGSVNPPTFTVLEYKPKVAKNKKPIVLVGKGLVFDTGGINIKTGDYMEDMKHDMAGGATVAATLFAIARLKLNIHVVALIPATDNRPNGNAMVPGDVITMSNGKTVEVVNTDAEGRLILADALHYAKRYQPELVIDAATLTGAASRITGKYAIVAMQQHAERAMQQLIKSGWNTYERIVELPLWDDYAGDIKSPVADIKNSGSGTAGAITAGKFLTEFIDYPYIHLDIAGVAFVKSKDDYHYHGKQATGFGVRLLIDFMAHFLV